MREVPYLKRHPQLEPDENLSADMILDSLPSDTEVQDIICRRGVNNARNCCK